MGDEVRNLCEGQHNERPNNGQSGAGVGAIRHGSRLADHESIRLTVRAATFAAILLIVVLLVEGVHHHTLRDTNRDALGRSIRIVRLYLTCPLHPIHR